MIQFPTQTERDAWAAPMRNATGDARATWLAKKDAEMDGLRDNIRQRIKTACTYGQRSVEIMFGQSEYWPIIQDELLQEGYTVASKIGSYAGYYVISWD